MCEIDLHPTWLCRNSCIFLCLRYSFETRYLNQNRHHRRQENYLMVATGDKTKTLNFCKSTSKTNSWLSKDGFFLVLHFFDPLNRWVFNSISFDGIANLLYLMRELDFQPLSSDIRRNSEWNISNMFEKKTFYVTRKTNWHILGKTVQFEKLGNALYAFTIELDSILLVFFS